MNNKLKKAIVILAVVTLLPFGGMAKKSKKKKAKPAYTFTVDKKLPHTPVKDQARSGTCWVFATISFLESEILRTKNIETDLSEMFIVRHAYPQKAVSYIRMHGNANFGPGGQSHDVTDQIRRFGIVPEAVYPGLNIEEKRHNHGEMGTILGAFLDAVLKRRGKRLTPRWQEAFAALLDVYLGKSPETFEYEGQTYTPKSFAKDYLGLDPDNYIELISYAHHPFYQKCRLEVPDNWSFDSNYYNVPIDELEKIIDRSIEKGFTVCWDADVSDKGFSPKGKEDLDVYDRAEYAVVPLKDWDDLTKAEEDEKYKKPVKEKEVTQEMRQKTFDNFTTTDDHLMHLVGTAHDQEGNKFYVIKNSWGTDRRFKGIQYISRSYLRLHTINIMIHKDALDAEMKDKLGIE